MKNASRRRGKPFRPFVLRFELTPRALPKRLLAETRGARRSQSRRLLQRKGKAGKKCQCIQTSPPDVSCCFAQHSIAVSSVRVLFFSASPCRARRVSAARSISAFASIPRTLAPALAAASARKPPPQPTSQTRVPRRGKEESASAQTPFASSAPPKPPLPLFLLSWRRALSARRISPKRGSV